MKMQDDPTLKPYFDAQELQAVRAYGFGQLDDEALMEIARDIIARMDREQLIQFVNR